MWSAAPRRWTVLQVATDTGLNVDLIGWVSAGILLLTIGRQVYTQWREGRTQGLSRWMFIGQMTASCGFIVYSVLLDNWVFVVTNVLLLVTAALGQCIYLRNRHRQAGAR